jgi:tripartite-type tricarboxylate transporter receptor subunit TctC
VILSISADGFIAQFWEDAVFTMKGLSLVGAAVVVLSALLLPASAQVQSWPQRTVKFIVPLGPGSGVDIGSRLFADRLSKKWGQPVVVENRPGGDGIVAITAFLSANDDHTLLMSPASAFTAHPYFHDKLSYNPRDLTPVARVSNTIVSVAVPESLKINSVAELVARARAEPGKLNWATITGLYDFAFSGFLKSANLDITRVPYRDTVQAANDLAEGRIQLMLAAIAIVRPHVQAGRVKMIAVTSHNRAPVAPDVPTVAEAGFSELTVEGLIGLFGLREMSTELRNRIAADIREAAADPVIRERLTATGQVLNPGTAAEFGAAIEEQRAQAAAVAKVLGVKPVQ